MPFFQHLVRHLGTPFLWRFSLLAGGLILLFAPVLPSFVVGWLGRDDFSHGFLVPLISLYLVYHKRHQLLREPLRPSALSGTLFLTSGLLLLVAGRLTMTVSLQQVSLLPVLAGIILLNFGPGHFRHLLVPFLYLVFMLPPVIDPLLARAYWPFQLFTATISETLYRLAGIPVFRDLQFLHLPEISLEVARECSGVRYLFSIIALAIPMAVFTQPTRPRKVALVICAVLIGILANPIRVLLIGVVVYYLHGDVHGPMHVLEGVSISIVGYVFLFLAVWAFGKLPQPQSVVPLAEEPLSPGREPEEGSGLVLPSVPWKVSLAALLLAAGVSMFHSTRDTAPSRALVLPETMGDWTAVSQREVGEGLIFHDADLSASRLYQNAHGDELVVHYAYFTSQNKDKKIVSYKNALQAEPSTTISLEVPAGAVRLRRTEVESDGRKYLTCYWYRIAGRTVSSPMMEKVLSLGQVLTANRNNGLAVSVSISYRHKEEIPAKEKLLLEAVPRVLALLGEGQEG